MHIESFYHKEIKKS